MLTGRMLRVKRSDGLIQPAFVDIEAKRYRRMATDLMDMVKAHIDRSRDDLVEAIDGMIGDNVQHRAHRGLADGDGGLFPDVTEALAEADGRRGLALAQGCGGDG